MADSSVKEKYSRYTQGGETDVYSSSGRLGWWERTEMPEGDDDITIRINARYAKRPDVVAYDFYGRANLMWLVLQYNKILDVNEEFIEGKIIKIPSSQRVFFDLTTKPNNSNYV